MSTSSPRTPKKQTPPPRHIEGLRWAVPSDSDPEIEYLVDLGAYLCLGRCTCPHFEVAPLEPGAPTRRATAQELSERGKEPPAKLRCKHITRAREAFTDQMLAAVIHYNPHHAKHD